MRHHHFMLVLAGFVFWGFATASGDEPAAEPEATTEADRDFTITQNEPLESGAAVRSFARALGAIFGGPRLDGASDEEQSELLGQPAPGFELFKVDGGTVRLEDLRGEIVVLDFWATWCGPCMRAMPEIQKVHEKFDGQKVRIIGVNQGERLEDVANMLEEKKFTFTQVLDSDSTVGDSFSVSGIPQTVVIDAEGVVQAVHVGYSPTLEVTLNDQIEKLLRGEQIFDPVKAAEAQKRREERLAETMKKLALKNENRLERLDEVLADSEATLSASHNNAGWFTIPGEPEQFLLVCGGRKVTVIRPRGGQADVTELQLSEGVSIWSCAPILIDKEIEWAIVGAKYDDDYDVEKLVVSLHDATGEPRWTLDLPVFEGDYSPAIFAVAANLTGDAQPEIAVTVNHGGLSEMKATGPGESTRVLTVFDAAGEQLLRTFVPGQGGVAMYALPDGDSNTLLMTTDEGLTRFQVKDGGE